MAMLNLQEAASSLNLNPGELEILVKSGKIEAYKIAGVYLRFKQDDISAFKSTLVQRNTKPGQKLVQKKPMRKLTRESMLDNELSLKNASLLEKIQDFWYFNNFYIISLGVMIFLIVTILK
ncbi:MAG: helix-turn-helix domain-containing protein [Candidatus Omnitrophota bacterium]|nr:helix-turn-helix domain-containing protein [Candidatus Omnitrophota bacterium]